MGWTRSLLLSWGLLGNLGCAGSTTDSGASGGTSSGVGGSGAASSGGSTGSGAAPSAGGGTTGSSGGSTGSGAALNASGGTTGGSGGSSAFMEAEFLGMLQHCTVNAYSTTDGAAEGYLVFGPSLGEDPLQGGFFMALPNVSGTFENQLFWFSPTGFYDGYVTVTVSASAPNVGDVLMGTFEGELAKTTGEEPPLPLTNGRFVLPRTE